MSKHNRDRREKKRIGQMKLKELIPPQDRYYLLSSIDGNFKYSRHGTSAANGLLVFLDSESANRFCEQVAWPACEQSGAIPPMIAEVSFREMMAEALEAGAVCRAEGTKVSVGILE